MSIAHSSVTSELPPVSVPPVRRPGLSEKFVDAMNHYTGLSI
jgi:hypothetical protein